MRSDHDHKVRTLWLSGILHAFTHIYQMALVPLYLLIQADFHLASEAEATLLVTVMGVAYFLPSYPLGVLADRVSRRKLLAFGLAINALGFVGLAWSPNYTCALAAVTLAGFGGSFYHPAATALVARLYPVRTGRALGLVAIGASAGFFISPIYAGWRAEMAHSWRAPVLELGLFGLVFAGIFYWLADEERGVTEVNEAGETRVSVPSPRDAGAGRGDVSLSTGSSIKAAPLPVRSSQGEGEDRKAVAGSSPLKSPAHAQKMFPTGALWFFFLSASFFFSLRDFAGSGMGSLGSLFLQQAHGFNPKTTGFIISGIFLASVASSPLFGRLSDHGRIRWTVFLLFCSLVLVAVFPRVPKDWMFVTLMAYGFFFLASYPVVEAALMESVPDAVRGRVFGLFITTGGLLGNVSHWAVGEAVQRLGADAANPRAYYSIYGALAGMLGLSFIGLPCLHAIRKREGLEPHLPSAPVPNPESILR